MSSEVQKKKIENKDNSISNIKNQNTTNVTMNDEDKKQNAFDVSRNKISLQIDEPIPAKKNKFYEFSDKIIKKVHNINYRKIFKKNFCTKTDIIFYITNSLSIVAYYIGLTPCEKDPSECTIKRGMAFYFMVGTFTAISARLYSVYIAFTLFVSNS